MAEIKIVPATKQHAVELGRIMRRKDREEILASGNLEPEKGLRASINASLEAYAVYIDGDLCAVYGISKLPGGWFIPWALTSEHVFKHPMAFYRESKRIVAELREKYRYMIQMVHWKYLESLSWLTRLGFTVEPPVKWGARDELFCRVTLTTPHLITA